MDEDFEYFLEKMGPAVRTQEVPATSIERYRGHLPNQLLQYWQAYGWSSYADGLFWTVNPEEFEPVVDAWLGETPFMEEDAYHLIARGAFGDLCFLGERTNRTLHLVSIDGIMMPPSECSRHGADFNIRAFFGSQNRGAYNVNRAPGGALFARALKKLGPLAPDEMYGFVPALALGGPAVLDHVQKVKAVEHLVMLAQLAPLRMLNL